MNIVERAAELLGSVERSNINSLAPTGVIERIFEQGTVSGLPQTSERAGPFGGIEPTIKDNMERFRSAPASEFKAQPGAGAPSIAVESMGRPAAEAPNSISQLLKIDRNQLRRQSLITPDGERTP